MNKTEEKNPLTKVQILTSKGNLPLAVGSVLVVCATPGFRRAGITHERVKIWSRRELNEEQINAMRGEPELTVIEVR